MMPEGEEDRGQVPVLVTIFNTRLMKLNYFLDDQQSEDAQRIIKDLRADIGRIPLKSFSVKKAFKEVRDAWEDDFWRLVTSEKLEFLRLKVAPLLRFVPFVRPAEAFFASKMERLGLGYLQKKPLTTLIDSIRQDVDLLPMNIAQVAAKRSYIDRLLTGKFFQALTLQSIDEARDALAPLMKYKREKPSIVIELGLDDIIDAHRWVVLKKDSTRMYVEEYRKKVEAKIEKIAKKHPTVRKLCLDPENMVKAFGVRVGSFVDFLKHVLHIETLPSYEQIVQKAFDAFILEHNYTADQSRFLRVVQSVFLQRRKLELADLYEEPFNSFGLNVVDKLFTEAEVAYLISLVKRLAA
jgi:type I restriction enzyme R subunit